MTKVLVAGGAGFIGSHIVAKLIEIGYDVTVFDDLSTGHTEAVTEGAGLIVCNIALSGHVDAYLDLIRPDVVIHLAGKSIVSDSMQNPFRYFEDNTVDSMRLIESCIKADVSKFIFSSTAAIFGENNHLIDEGSDINPGSPYGESKLTIEKMLKWAYVAHGLNSVSLRYFNAAGADARGLLGEDHRNETHLIPRAIDSALKRTDIIKVFGTNFNTVDGSAVRDFIHVDDLADAHVLAMKLLHKSNGAKCFNLGTGVGHSVFEVLTAVDKAAGFNSPSHWAPRRLGDPDRLVADSTLFKEATGWTPKYPDLETIVRHAYQWRVAHPNGYRRV